MSQEMSQICPGAQISVLLCGSKQLFKRKCMCVHACTCVWEGGSHGIMLSSASLPGFSFLHPPSNNVRKQRLAQLWPLNSQLRDKVCHPSWYGSQKKSMVPHTPSGVFCGRLTIDYIQHWSVALPTSFCLGLLPLKPLSPRDLYP